MPYVEPYIDASGLHIPTYQDILDQLTADARSIFGTDIYLDNDSQDYQYISIFASMLHDSHNLLVAIYNNRGPQSAIGSGLDGVVKLNGIKRKESSYSTCVLTLVGTPGVGIENGICEDESGVRWILPSLVTIDGDGSINVSARSENVGEITALPHTITVISTPTRGWISVDNEDAAIVGQPVEKDSSLRARQQNSTMLPSQALLDGTRGAIQAVQNVSRSRVYENDTNQIDGNGLPPHSICAVVEGGLDFDIANEIFLRKTPGCFTYGDIIVEIQDQSGMINSTRFFRPDYQSVDVTVEVKPLGGFTSSTKASIEASVKNYLTSLKIGENVRNSSLWGASLLPVRSLENPIYAVVNVTVGFTGDPLLVQDLEINFKSVSEVGTVTIEVIP